MPEHAKDMLEIYDEYSIIDEAVWDAVEDLLKRPNSFGICEAISTPTHKGDSFHRLIWEGGLVKTS